ncbi:RNA-binding protein [Candidatus Pacearchaeota archaeon CG10_big_fil_rev_8_21_14_0_10_34_12]|nr:MAG: RNA-binding protein [Candidatus Pacearchaeota archaeon CG10_big_fil_rev_8_21_14_0_10_34_12]
METTRITGERIREYMLSGKRFDGRNLEDFREITIEKGVSKNAEGSARVKIGNTEVVVGVKMSVSEPYPDSPDKGNLMVTSELLPLSSDRFESGPPRIESIELARVIDRCIRESKFIEFEKLCITPGEKVWTVFVDIYSINADGNLIDAAGIGALAALKNAKIPEYNEKEGVVYGSLTNKKIPVKKEIPLSITFHKIGESIIVDPTQEEEDVSEARVTIGSHEGVISSMQKGNSKEIKEDEMFKILDLNEKVWKELFLKIEKSFKD